MESAETYENTAEPLTAALKFVRTLELYAGDEVATHLLAGEVQLRRRKWLLGLRALTRAKALMGAGDTGEVHLLAVRMALAYASAQGEAAAAPAVAEVVRRIFTKLNLGDMSSPGDKSALEGLNARVRSDGRGGARTALACAQVDVLLGVAGAAAGQALAEHCPLDASDCSHTDAVAVADWLEKVDPPSCAAFAQRCGQRFPLSARFGGDLAHLYPPDRAGERAPAQAPSPRGLPTRGQN